MLQLEIHNSLSPEGSVQTVPIEKHHREVGLMLLKIRGNIFESSAALNSQDLLTGLFERPVSFKAHIVTMGLDSTNMVEMQPQIC